MSFAFCPNCGTRLEESTNFCPNCGSSLTSAVQTYTDASVIQTPVSTAVCPVPAAEGYSLILVSLGSCAKVSARSLLRDLLGYTVTDAIQITNTLPAEIACALNFQQAVDLSRVLSEYGMQVAAYDSAGYVDLSSYADRSALSSSGSILETVLATIATITIANRVKKILKWMRPAPQQNLFKPKYMYTVPPRYERKVQKRKPVPKPVSAAPLRKAPAAHHEQREPFRKDPGRPEKGRKGGAGPKGPGRQ